MSSGKTPGSYAYSEASRRRFVEKLVMVGHLTPGMALPVEALANLTQHHQPCVLVYIGSVDALSTVATRGDVVETTGQFNSERACHGRSMALGM